MKNIINEFWHGNIIPQEDSINNSKEMKELLGCKASRGFGENLHRGAKGDIR